MASKPRKYRSLRRALKSGDGLLLRPLVWAVRAVMPVVVWAHSWWVAVRMARRIRRGEPPILEDVPPQKDEPTNAQMAAHWRPLLAQIQGHIASETGQQIPAPLIAGAIFRAVRDAGVDFADCGCDHDVYERIKGDLLAGRMDREIYRRGAGKRVTDGR
jgi:hypothetical protein